jgi:hypothetical protein|tara:strand:- start:1153 stop:1458 length:306 start_codon:yes stop_codon:yes gene_type:complete
MKTIKNLALSSLVLLSGCATYQTRIDCAVPVPDVQAMRQGSKSALANVVQYGGKGLSYVPKTGSQVMDAVPEVYDEVSGSLNELGNYVEQGSKDLADKIRP